MNESKPTLSALLAEAFPSSSPTLQLEDRILARTPARTRLPRRTIRFAFATAGFGLVAFGLIALTPKALAFAEFKRMEAAADALPEWRMATFTPDMKGKLVQSGETWCRNGQVLEEREFGQVELLRSGNSVVEYRKGEDHAIRSPGADASGQMKKLSGFIQELQRSTSLLGLTLDRNVEIEGRAATRISALSKNEPIRISIYADPQSDVPFLALVEIRSDGSWRVERRITIDASPHVASGVTFALPSNVRVVDESTMQQEWTKKLGTPIATYPGASEAPAVQIRDVWMNMDGVVFVMYTNGRSPRPVDMSHWKSITLPDGRKAYQNPNPVAPPAQSPELMTISDDSGTQYSKLDGFQGFETSTDGSWNRGLTWPDGDAMVDVYAPTFPQKAAPRRIKLSFGFTSYTVPKNFKPHGPNISFSEMTPNRVTSAVHEQTLEPHPSQMPEWADFIGICPKPLDLDAEIAAVRGKAAIARGDGSSAEAYARDYIRLTQMESAQSGNGYVMCDRYDLLGQALEVEGKTEEAIQAWKKALDDAQSDDHERIEKEISGLRVIPR